MKIVIEGKVIRDCENENRYYVELPDGWRIIFEDDEYAGCYFAGEEEKKPVVKPIGSGRYPWGEKEDKKEEGMSIFDFVDWAADFCNLLETRTKATEHKDGSMTIVTDQFPIQAVLFGADDPMSSYFQGDAIEWFKEHHYAHPEQCAILAKFYREYKEGQNNPGIYEDFCLGRACCDCIINEEYIACKRNFELDTAEYGGYTKSELLDCITKIFKKDLMVQDKYGDYYDPDKYYAGRGGIVCAGDCYHVKNIRKENRREFNTLAEALTIGRCRECKHCHGHHKK